jgi:hypothetical protein
MNILKQFYTRELANPPLTFDTAQQNAVRFRTENAGVVFQDLTLPQTRTLFLAPMLYRFGGEIGVPPVVCARARDFLLAVLSTTFPEEEGGVSPLEIGPCSAFLDAYAAFELEDRERFRDSLFLNLYQMSQLDKDAFEGAAAGMTEKLYRYVRLFRWEAEYSAFCQQKQQESVERLWETMDRAFWDHFKDSLVRGDHALLRDTITEVRGLLLDIPHPTMHDPEAFLTDILDPEHLLTSTDLGVHGVEHVLDHVFRYLRECDSEAMESAYDAAWTDLQSHKTDAPSFLTEGLKTAYAFVIQLKAKLWVLQQR